MKFRQIGVLIVCSVFLLTQVSSANAGAIPVPPKDANFTIQQEVALSTLGLLAALVGEDAIPLCWSGKITDSKWTYKVSSPYRDGHLILRYRGRFDDEADVIHWTGHGSFTNSFGSLEWEEEGSYSDATVDGLFRKIVRFVAKSAVTAVAVVATVSIVGSEAATVTSTAGLGTGTALLSIGGITGVAVAAGKSFSAIDKALPDKNGSTKVTSSLQQSLLGAPFLSPFPIRIPGLLRNPDPNYPPIFASQVARIENYANSIVSVSGSTDTTAEGLLVTVDGVDAIFLAGRTDVPQIPPPNGDPNAFILIRHDRLLPEFPLTETLPPSIPIAEGATVSAVARATGGVDFFPGFNEPTFGPDGNEGSESILFSLGGISGYHGPEGALAGVFLDDGVPNTGPAPDSLDFTPSGLGTNFTSLSPALRQVFFIGDGFTDAGEAQQFIAPFGATRLVLGIPDGFGFDGPPGAYDDNNGAYEVRIRVITP